MNEQWLEELPKVLWAHRTTKRRPTMQTPFKLMFGSEAIIPTEVGLPTLKMDIAELTSENELQLAQNLDLIKETRDIAAL